VSNVLSLLALEVRACPVHLAGLIPVAILKLLVADLAA
jgi:hypothetical protein